MECIEDDECSDSPIPCIFVDMGTCLSSHCLAMMGRGDTHIDSTVISKVGIWDHLTVCVSVCLYVYPPSLLGSGSVNVFCGTEYMSSNGRIVGCIIFNVDHVSKESRRLILPRTLHCIGLQKGCRASYGKHWYFFLFGGVGLNPH
jgi:hypothetical protein